MSQNVTELANEKDFEQFIKKGFIIIDFFAEWCMPCVIMAPIMEELSKKFKSKIKFGKINVDENQELARKYKVFSIPNFILFKDGKILERFIGSMSSEEFEKKIKKFL